MRLSPLPLVIRLGVVQVGVPGPGPLPLQLVGRLQAVLLEEGLVEVDRLHGHVVGHPGVGVARLPVPDPVVQHRGEDLRHPPVLLEQAVQLEGDVGVGEVVPGVRVHQVRGVAPGHLGQDPLRQGLGLLPGDGDSPGLRPVGAEDLGHSLGEGVAGGRGEGAGVAQGDRRLLARLAPFRGPSGAAAGQGRAPGRPTAPAATAPRRAPRRVAPRPR